MKIPILPIPLGLLQKNDPIKKRIKWEGLDIEIEWKKGEIRQYVGSDFKKFMYASYGYIRNTTSIDREEIDVYVKEKGLKNFEVVFKVKQMKDPAEGKGGHGINLMSGNTC